jgi:hypothetical protein
LVKIEREPSLINPSKSKNFKRFGKSKIKLLTESLKILNFFLGLMNGWFGFNDVIIFPSRVMGLHLSFSNLILLLPNLLKFLDLLTTLCDQVCQ